MKKLTDEEIIKAMEEWRKELIADYQRLQLLDAPMDCFEESHVDIVTKLSNTLDLINRQQAEIDENTELRNLYRDIQKQLKFQNETIRSQEKEIERLKEAPKCIYQYDGEMTEFCVEAPCQNYKTEEQIKSEAYKEFAEKLAFDFLITNNYKSPSVNFAEYIEKFLKEMVDEK